MTNRDNYETLYGRQPVLEVLRAQRRKIREIRLAVNVNPTPELDEIVATTKARGIQFTRAASHDLDQFCEGGHHQGVAAVVAPYPYVTLAQVLEYEKRGERDPLYLILDHIEDPQNVGSLLRSAEAAGVDAVFIPKHRAAGITAAAVRASAGASEHLHVVLIANVVNCMETLKKHEVWIAGLNKGETSIPYDNQDLTGPLGLVIGSEGRGMARLVKEHCDYLIELPMHGSVSSLNAGVSGGIALYEILRQRRAKTASIRT